MPAPIRSLLSITSARLPASAMHRRCDELSGGQKQRVAIARALAQASDILLLDEPTTALDLRYQLEIQSVLRGLNTSRGTTLVIATHDLNLAASICHELVMMRDGRVVGDRLMPWDVLVAEMEVAAG